MKKSCALKGHLNSMKLKDMLLFYQPQNTQNMRKGGREQFEQKIAKSAKICCLFFFCVILCILWFIFFASFC